MNFPNKKKNPADNGNVSVVTEIAIGNDAGEAKLSTIDLRIAWRKTESHKIYVHNNPKTVESRPREAKPRG